MLAAALAVPSFAQQNVPLESPAQLPATAQANKGPALMDPAGPTVSLQASEPMFYMGAALNACGYDDGLSESNPVRMTVREEVNQATQASAAARTDRDQLCAYIDQHQLSDPAQNLAQYVSLALYLTQPPMLTPSVDEQDLPPDANGVLLMLPLLRRFAQDIDLNAIWAANRPAYDALQQKLHAPLSDMITATNYYLKMPAQTYSGRRFLVVIEPMFSPEETNARVYGADYVVVASPKDGKVPMRLVRHVYLHYVIEPMLYSRQNDMIRMEPILRTVAFAPLSFNFKNDIVALVVECMIKAIEARTLDTGIGVVDIPPDLPRSQAVPLEEERNQQLSRIAAIKEQLVQHDMRQGYVITQYFYNQLIGFEKTGQSLQEAIGPMVYGMDVPAIMSVAKNIDFDTQGEGEMLGREPQQPQGLDLAELKLMKGDVAAAGAMAEQAIADHTGEPGRAEFILARVDLMSNNVQGAVAAFKKTLAEATDTRYIAWSHIFLGRIYDVNQERAQAVAQYKAAMDARDGQPDTLAAAQAGLKQPFALPPQAESTSQTAPPAKQPASATQPGAPQ